MKIVLLLLVALTFAGCGGDLRTDRGEPWLAETVVNHDMDPPDPDMAKQPYRPMVGKMKGRANELPPVGPRE